jgi:ankyrin repeat protein
LDPHYQVVALIEAKADVNQAKTSDGATPVDLAAQHGHTAIVDALHLASQQALSIP